MMLFQSSSTCSDIEYLCSASKKGTIPKTLFQGYDWGRGCLFYHSAPSITRSLDRSLARSLARSLTCALFKANTKVAAFGRHHKGGRAAFGRAAPFVVSFVLALKRAHVSERASDRASERSSERVIDGASERPSERATERASDRRATSDNHC